MRLIPTKQREHQKVLWASQSQGTFRHDADSERQQRKAVIKVVGIRQAKRLYREEMRNA